MNPANANPLNSLDGDGYDDYLYVNDNGAVLMWRNLQTNPISWGLPHLVADGVGVLARQVQFADVDGDGLLDYNVVGSVTGKTRTWHNLGFENDTIRWNTPLSFAGGVGTPGFTVRIAQASQSNWTFNIRSFNIISDDGRQAR